MSQHPVPSIHYFVRLWNGADDGNRTRILGLENRYFTVKSYLHMAISCQWGCHPKAFCISLDELRFFRPSVSLAFHKLLHLRPCYSLTLFKLGCIIISIAMKLTYFTALSWSLYFGLRSTNGDAGGSRTRDSTVKGWRLNHLTTAPYLAGNKHKDQHKLKIFILLILFQTMKGCFFYKYYNIYFLKFQIFPCSVLKNFFFFYCKYIITYIFLNFKYS